MEKLSISKVESTNEVLIKQIANWYLNEWAIPEERTVSRLTNHPNEDVLLQIVLNINDTPVATGGLYNNVSIHQVYPEFKTIDPWVALLYTETNYRNKGLGSLLLETIEKKAIELNYTKLYLFTFTAESLYKRNGWSIIKRVDYRGHDTAIMIKYLD